MSRTDEFMGWMIEMGKKVKAKEIKHPEMMRLMRDLYPEFTPDDKEGETTFEDKCDNCGECVCEGKQIVLSPNIYCRGCALNMLTANEAEMKELKLALQS
jgi:formylmethanofuran dehydrogenase subunit E